MEPPTHTLTWQVSRSEAIPGLDLVDKPIPQLGKKDVLVKIHAASLNFRDIMVLNGHYPFEIIPNVTPLSDAAGEVISVGSEVIDFRKNDKVITAMNGDFASGPIKPEILTRVLGSSVHGVAAEYVVFPENFLLHLPRNLSFIEGSTLPTAGLTAWNALYGAQGRPLKPGDWVLTQGTGGVSTFVILFAKAAGAKVVAVTSSDAKAEVLKQQGADHVINYSEIQDWGSTVKSLTPDNAGVDIAVEIGGGESIIQSFAALKMDGLLGLVGFRSGKPQEQSILTSIGSSFATMRMVYVGPRSQYEEMNKFIEQHDIHPLVDKEVFPFQNLRESFTYLASMKHMGKRQFAQGFVVRSIYQASLRENRMTSYRRHIPNEGNVDDLTESKQHKR